MDPEDALNPKVHDEGLRLTKQLGVLVRKVAFLDMCMAFLFLGVLSWRQIALHVVLMHPYTTGLSTWVGRIIAEQAQERRAADSAAVAAHEAKKAVAAATMAARKTRPRTEMLEQQSPW
jgi:hypothetical protein